MKVKIQTLLLAGVCAAAIGGVTAGSAMAASVTAATGPASVSTTAAVITGLIEPAGYRVTYEFQYGTTTSYGKTTTALTLPPQATGEVAIAAITGLTPGTTYDYRLVATEDVPTTADTAYYPVAAAEGNNATFTTTALSTTTTKTTSTVSLSSNTAKVKSKTASVSLKCKGNTACKGTLTLDKKVKVTTTVKGKKKTKTETKKLGSKSYSIAAGKTGTVKVKLSSYANGLLKKGNVSGTATAKANTGLTGFKNKSITLKS